METSPSSGGGGDAVSAAESALSTAGALVDKHILVNDDYLDLAGLLGVASHMAPAVSGLQVCNYRCICSVPVDVRKEIYLLLPPTSSLFLSFLDFPLLSPSNPHDFPLYLFPLLPLSLPSPPPFPHPFSLFHISLGSRLPFSRRRCRRDELSQARSPSSRARGSVFDDAVQLRHGPLYQRLSGVAHHRL